ncbi:helix-hairpin-helix domain-containing protein [Flavihumibacter sp. R14]|nr:helix-hairpin-helix domain-containing protein [Flavihumibacter soli]
MSYGKLCVAWLFLVVLLGKIAVCQVTHDELIDQILQEIAADLPEDYDFSDLTERLMHYHRKPLNINTTSREQLQEFVFLSPLQINAFLQHREQNGNLVDLMELQSISAFDTVTIRRLLPFVCIGPQNSLEGLSIKTLFKKGSNDLMIRYGQYLQPQQGYIPDTGKDQAAYSGGPGRLNLRYRYRYGENVSASINLEKDPGEKLFPSARSVGLDFSSANVFVRDIGRIKKLTIGDYSLQFGQGLAMWTGLTFGKGSMVTNIAKPEIGLQPYQSTNEHLFLRGIAATVRLRNIEITPFLSFRKVDGAVDTTNGIFQVTSLQQTGLHRTRTEMDNKHAIPQNLVGANIKYIRPNFNAGITGYHLNLGYPVQAGQHLYDMFDFSGSSLYNLAFNYGLTVKNSYVFGEAAYSGNGKAAFVNGLLSSLSNEVSTVLLHRHYPKEYHSFFNQALAESSNSVNESGFYSGLIIRPSQWEISVFADYFRFPWLKFGIDGPSEGHEILAHLNYTPNKRTNWRFRYKTELKQDNDAIENQANILENVRIAGYRFDFSSKISRAVTLRNRLEISTYKRESFAAEHGLLVYQDLIYDALSLPYSANMRIAIFKTSGFNSRIYAYENDVLYSYSIPAYQNSGLRLYLNTRYSLSRKMDIWMRYSITKYKDLETIGNGNDQITGDHRSEIKVQLRYQY